MKLFVFMNLIKSLLLVNPCFITSIITTCMIVSVCTAVNVIILFINLFISYFDTTNIQPFLLLCKYNCTFNMNLTFFNCIASKTTSRIKPDKTSFILFFGCWCVFQEKIIKNQKINHFKNYIYAHVLYIYILFYFIFDLISYIHLTYRKLRG